MDRSRALAGSSVISSNESTSGPCGSLSDLSLPFALVRTEKAIQSGSVRNPASVGGDGCADPLAAGPFACAAPGQLAFEAENAALRRQIIVLRRKLLGRVKLSNMDRLLLSGLSGSSRRYAEPS